MIKDFVTLRKFSQFEDATLLTFRAFIGSFLVWGVWDNVLSLERMNEFAGFLAGHGFAYPHIMAPLSVYAQLLCGVCLVTGFATRWAGLVCAFNFVVAIIMVDGPAGIRTAFPAASLVAFGLYVAARGGGKFAFDAMLQSDDKAVTSR